MEITLEKIASTYMNPMIRKGTNLFITSYFDQNPSVTLANKVILNHCLNQFSDQINETSMLKDVSINLT